VAAAIGDPRVRGGGPERAKWRRREPAVSVLHLNRAERGENEWWGRELGRMRRQWRPRRPTHTERVEWMEADQAQSQADACPASSVISSCGRVGSILLLCIGSEVTHSTFNSSCGRVGSEASH